MHSRYDDLALYGHVETRVRGRTLSECIVKPSVQPTRMTPVLIIFKVKLAARL